MMQSACIYSLIYDLSQGKKQKSKLYYASDCNNSLQRLGQVWVLELLYIGRVCEMMFAYCIILRQHDMASPTVLIFELSCSALRLNLNPWLDLSIFHPAISDVVYITTTNIFNTRWWIRCVRNVNKVNSDVTLARRLLTARVTDRKRS